MPRFGRKFKPSHWESAKNAKHTLLSSLKTIPFIRQHGDEEDIKEIRNGLQEALEQLKERERVCVNI